MNPTLSRESRPIDSITEGLQQKAQEFQQATIPRIRKLQRQARELVQNVFCQRTQAEIDQENQEAQERQLAQEQREREAQQAGNEKIRQEGAEALERLRNQ